MDVCWWSLYNQGAKLAWNKSVSTNLAVECRRKDILLSHGIPLNKISHWKWVHKYLRPERRHPRSFWMLRACKEDQRAKSEKLNFDVIWLDLANAYGSVPHQMIQLALRMYHVPEDIQVMLDDCFSGFRMKFSTIRYTIDWINLEIGIAMGCTIFPILFVMAMEVNLKAAEDSAGPTNLGDGCYISPLKAFMDDTTIICSKEDETRRMLERLDVLMAWCRMRFKPKKSRSLLVRKGKIDATTIFTVANQQIPTVSQEPVKSNGRWYDSSMKDTKGGLEAVELVTEGLLAINRCGLQGKLKVWCLQFMLIPKLLWPLLVYEIWLTTVEAIEAKINKFTRRWLGVQMWQCIAAKQSLNPSWKSINMAKPGYSLC